MKKIVCEHCGYELNVNHVLKALRPGGYKTFLRVREKATNEIFILAENDINPELYEVVEGQTD